MTYSISLHSNIDNIYNTYYFTSKLNYVYFNGNVKTIFRNIILLKMKMTSWLIHQMNETEFYKKKIIHFNLLLPTSWTIGVNVLYTQ